MRRSAFHLFGLTILGLALVGCGGKKNKTAMNDPYDQPLDQPATTDPYGGGTYGSQPLTDSSYTSGSRTHVVQKKETLFSIARMHYNGDASKWKAIYEANRDQIPNKDQIRVGQKLIIP